MGLTDYLHGKKPVGSTTPERASSSGHRFSVGSSSSTPAGGSADGSAPADDVSVLGEDEGNVLMSLIKQLHPGMDLTKISLPTFVLEPRSMLERVTDFFSHPDLIFGASQLEDPKERFLAVLRYYLSGWHIKPQGVKKPYNAVLGEIFRCSYKYPDGSEGFYVAEQVSHHPPISAYFYCSPKNGVLIYGELRPKSKFLGNSAATIMDGASRVILMDRPEDGEYDISMPNHYARGILFGKLILELGDNSTAKCVKTGISCDVEFKTKGFFSGTYNAVAGKVNGPKGHIGDVSGLWSESMEFKDAHTGRTQQLFDAHSASITPKTVAPLNQQEPNESRRLWADLTEAIKRKDMEGAQEAKSRVEESQRELARRTGGEENHQLRYFTNKGDRYVPSCGLLADLPKDRDECTEMLRGWIWDSSIAQPSTFSSISTASPTSTPVATPATSQSATSSSSTGVLRDAPIEKKLANLNVADDPPPAVLTAPGPPKGHVSPVPPGAY